MVAGLLSFGAVQAALEQSPICRQDPKQYEAKADPLSPAESNEPAPHETDSESSEKEPHFCYAGHTAEEWIGILTAGLAGFTWLLAMATAALWLDTRSTGDKQLRAALANLKLARKQLTSATKAHERELRAYVNIDDVRIYFDPGHKRWESRVTFRNYGNTPAHDVRIFGVLELTEWPIIESALKQINKDDPDASRFVLGPDACRTKTDEPYKATPLDFGIESIRHATWEKPVSKALVAHGKIFYFDVFGAEERVTEYRYYTGGNERPTNEVVSPVFPGQTTGPWTFTYRMVAHSKGNQAT